jgi:putative transposase
MKATNKKRHSKQEIAAKMRQADEMARQGKTQPVIARALGISVMTYHRWRKDNPVISAGQASSFEPKASMESPSDLASEVQELRVQNGRLRRLVTDLVLEKMALEEQLKAKVPSRKSAA